MGKRLFRVWRGDQTGGRFEEYAIDVDQGMVVLDCIHRIQAYHATDLACRWNCKAGKCGSCSMEINGKPRLSCMTRMNVFKEDEVITVQPIKTFPLIKDLVSDVSWNYEQNKRIVPFKPGKKNENGDYVMFQRDVERVQEFRKCIECFLCQNVCHVLRDHDKKDKFIGPRFLIRLASLEMHPLDTADRIPQIKDDYGTGMCNITKCCTQVCPEHIQITDNGIIPLKERVVSRYYDPILLLWRKIFSRKSES
ncbi:MAG: succinate dehydrogenase/fumarate reductase iron-sulfur subunit [Candidatus Omnitrophica bacterium]|nr:succinate dehydrogenase/fumarate reductase iron-sulfur subunit [Candidatus Omnitrophota bacterium]